VAQALVTVGAGGEIMAQEAQRAGLPAEAVLSVPSRAEAPAALERVLRPGDAVLVKGSRGLRLEETVRWLLNEQLAVSD
jgi:UDP-N-acetylmuramoyl-tripeptide--D-alanyl-D-alanine ligase